VRKHLWLASDHDAGVGLRMLCVRFAIPLPAFRGMVAGTAVLDPPAAAATSRIFRLVRACRAEDARVQLANPATGGRALPSPRHEVMAATPLVAPNLASSDRRWLRTRIADSVPKVCVALTVRFLADGLVATIR